MVHNVTEFAVSILGYGIGFIGVTTSPNSFEACFLAREEPLGMIEEE